MRPLEKEEESFKERILQASKNHSSKIVLALDLEEGSPNQLLEQGQALLDKTLSHVCAVKLGRQTILNLGTNLTAILVERIHREGVPCIIDDKLNDIGETNRAIARAYFRLGFDGITANPFVGWTGGLQPVFQIAHKEKKGIIILVHMSHEGAAEGYGQRVLAESSKNPRPQYEVFAQKAVEWDADGVVVGATRPEIISSVRSIIGERVPIYSPGIGMQGGDLAMSLRAGADYFIIGRAISKALDPEKVAARFARESMAKTR